MAQRMFKRYIGIDYSGADTPLDRLDGLAIYCADGDDPPQSVTPQSLHNPPQRNIVRWNRREVAQLLVQELREEDKPTLVGIDHAFSFPIPYFDKHGLPRLDWDHFLRDFQYYWPTDGDSAKVAEIRNGKGQHRNGASTWKRLTDNCSGTAKSVFQFGVNGSVAHSTHAGLPWLRYIRKELGDGIHFWPFDGWDVEKDKSVIAEVYPSLWRGRFRRAAYMNDHKHDAYGITGWLSHADRNRWLADFLNPNLSPEEHDRASTEGWILGVPGFIDLDQE